MKINEITDVNRSWLQLYGLEFEYFVTNAALIQDAYPEIKRTKSPALIQFHHREINQFLEDIMHFSNVLDNAPDQADLDVLDYRKRLRNMYSSIFEMVSK